MPNKLACCYHPCLTIFVDDDERFLKSIAVELKQYKIAYKTFTRAQNVLNFLQNEYKPNYFTKRCILRPEERDRDHRNLEVNVREIHRVAQDPNRFLEVAILVIDYAMPGMNGLELAQKFKDTPFKIILLTGEADEKIAIEAFNKGIIHKFIRKDEANFMEMLHGSVRELELEYFKTLSELIIDSLTKNPEYPPSCLDDPVFIELFIALNKKMKPPHEFYLMDTLGSYMFLSYEGNLILLGVKDEDAMAGAAMDAELSDKKVPTDVLKSLKDKNKLVYLFSDQELKKDPSEWLPYLHTAKEIQGRQKYYYSLIESVAAYEKLSGIISYKEFFEKNKSTFS